MEEGGQETAILQVMYFMNDLLIIILVLDP